MLKKILITFFLLFKFQKTAVNTKPISIEQIKKDFETMDTNNDGYLSAGDLRRSMPGITEDNITYIFDSYDGDRDGILTFEEYMTLVQDSSKNLPDEANQN